MYFALFILFAAILCSGLSVYFIPKLSEHLYQLLVIFGGSYLFSFMLVHMLPELFAGKVLLAKTIGLYLLIGFFIQVFLDFLSHGLAHGTVEGSVRPAVLSLSKGANLLIALCLHALLEGVLLGIFPENVSSAYCKRSLFIGVLLHEMPIALTLAVMLDRTISSKPLVAIFLFIFALASPVGWLLAHYLQLWHLLSSKTLLAIQAMATGNLLHIATTILFAPNLHHHFNLKQLFVVLAGGIMALLM